MISLTSALSLTAATSFIFNTESTYAAAPSTAYQLVYEDNFNGTELDTGIWNYNYPWSNQHNHRAYMTEDQVFVENGNLNLQAIHERHPDATDSWHNQFGWLTRDYQTGAVNTQGKFNFTYGYVEASLKLPDSVGSWPAFWMLEDGWPPEIDIMEFLVREDSDLDTYHAYYHYAGSNGNTSFGTTKDTNVNLTEDFHTFGMEWTPGYISFFIDGERWYTNYNSSAVQQAEGMYLILNHAVGGWAGDVDSSDYPSDYLIDWVRVWQKETNGELPLYRWRNDRGSGLWHEDDNWLVEAPNAQNTAALFSNNDQASVHINWDSPIEVGGLVFSSSTEYTLGDSNKSISISKENDPGYITVTAGGATDHTIHADINAANGLVITNESGVTELILNGDITGGGTLALDGSGITVFNHENLSFTGDILLDINSQGPGRARVTQTNALGSGDLIFSKQGNSTSGVLELLSDANTSGIALSNNITLSGRTHESIAITNLAGNNTLHGKISAIAGGSYYMIESQSGLLTLTGDSTQAGGVVFDNTTGRFRNLTLTGAGDGLISGMITNGTGTTALTKSGTGTWTLAGINTYSAGTTIEQGTLIVNGTTGSGDVNILQDATLMGDGQIHGAIALSGKLNPGSGQGVTGELKTTNIQMLAGSILTLEIASLTDFDRLLIDGQLNINDDVTLELILLENAAVQDGDTFDVLDFATTTGLFTNIVSQDGVIWDTDALSTTGVLRLVSIPEPALLTPMVLGLTTLLTRRRRAA